MDVRQIKIEDFSYVLPEAQIAFHPLAERDQSRLLLYRNGEITEDIYKNIAGRLPEDSLLIFNNTRVIAARILFKKPSGGHIEIFCLEPHSRHGDITSAMLQKKTVWWNCLVGGASKWKQGLVLEKRIDTLEGPVILTARIVERQPNAFTIEFDWQPTQLSFAELLHTAGFIPLPPYIKRQAVEEDKERYQTIYAKNEGSVAAPTAGLHFTENVFGSLRARRIQTDFVTLHVGAGTFKPVKSALINDHEMHTEFFEVSRATIEKLIQFKNKIYCVGTTSLRTLESLYWMGVKLLANPDLPLSDLPVRQWEVYEDLPDNIATDIALRALGARMDKEKLDHWVSQTQILIAPGYRVKMISGLVTNFHQPQSTLLLLIAALIGKEWRNVYDYALRNQFRFLSYGDGCLLFTQGINPLPDEAESRG